MKKITLNSLAKVNIGLNIESKLINGYHLVKTVYLPIPLFDVIEFASIEDNLVEISCNNNEVPHGENNLIFKAVQVFKNYSKSKKGVKVNLEKNIPIGAGLGGGSSNAATTLKALNIIWGDNFDISILKKMALLIGSDVACFLTDGIKVESQGGVKAGNFLLLPDLPSCYLLLCFPDIYIGSKKAYSNINYEQTNLNDLDQLVLAIKENNLDKIISNIYNSFEEWSFLEYPEIKNIKSLMIKLGAKNALMSGKGSSVFGIFEKEKFVKVACKELKKTYEFVKVFKL